MKILIITDLYPPYFVGGYEIKCKLHADELIRRGHTVSILTSNWRVEKDLLPEDNVFRLLHTNRYDQLSHSQKGMPDRLRLQRRIRQLRRALACRKNYRITQKIADVVKPDLVYVWQLNDVSISPVLAVQNKDIPIVFRLDDYWLANLRRDICLEPNPIKRWFRAAVIGLGNFDRINFSHMLVVSRSVKMSYVDAGFLENNIEVIPEGVPSDIILTVSDLPNPIAKDDIRLLYVGRVVHQKGTHVALDALSLLTDEMNADIRLDIIGVGPDDYIEQLKSVIVKLGLVSRVTFVGFVEHRQVLLGFSNYDMVLIPSLWEEPLSGTIAEAMARGLPVIATDRGGNPEIITHAENGLLVPPNDSNKLADAIKMLVDNPILVRKIQLQALNTVHDYFMHEQIIDRVEEYFGEVLVSKSTQR